VNPRSRRTIAASGGLAVTLALLAEVAGVPEGAPRLSDAAPPPRAANAAPALKPVEAYAAIADRPLFQPSRRPAVPPPPKPAPAVAQAAPVAPAPPPPPPAPPPVLAPMTLLAVVISAGKREAVLGLSGGKSSTLAEGDSLDGWTLVRVLPDSVVFRIAETEKELTFPVGQTAVRPAPVHPLTHSTPPTQRPH
jgi:hypothetical protein